MKSKFCIENADLFYRSEVKLNILSLEQDLNLPTVPKSFRVS